MPDDTTQFIDNYQKDEGLLPDSTVDYTDYILGGQSSKNAKLDISVREGFKKSPAEAAETLELSEKSGLPNDIVERQKSRIKEYQQQKEFDLDKFSSENPITAEWLADNPNHAAIAKEELLNIGSTERYFRYLKEQWKIGQLQDELNDINGADFDDKITSDQTKREFEIEKELGTQENYGYTGFIETAPGAILQQVPVFWDIFKGSITGAGVTAAPAFGVGAGVGLVTGPGALATGTGAALAVAPYGAMAGGAVSAYYLERNAAFGEFKKMEIEDVYGQKSIMDRDAAKGAAQLVGLMNAGLEMVGFGMATKLVPGMKILKQKLSRQTVRQMLQVPTVRRAFVNIAKRVGQGMAGEGATEFLQEWVNVIVGRVAQLSEGGQLENMSPSQIITDIFGDEANWSRTAEAARMGAQAGGGISVATSGTFGFGKDMHDMRMAENSKQALDSMAEGLANSEAAKKAPKSIENLVSRMTEGTPIENLFVPVEFFQEYFQTKGVDPAIAAEEIIGDTQQYQEALRDGTDIAIPTKKYAVSIAQAPEIHEAFSEEIKTSQNAMSVKSKRELMEKMEGLSQTHQDVIVPTVERLKGELLETGHVTEVEADRMMNLWQNTILSLAARTGQDPEELIKRYNVSIGTEGFMPGKVYMQEAPISRPFYHKLQRTIEDKLPENVSVQQLRGTIKDIKPEEIKWSGLEDFISDKKKVNKKELLDHLRANQLEIEEVVATPEGIAIPTEEEARLFWDYSEEEWNAKSNEEKQQIINDTSENPRFRTEAKYKTKFGDYVIPGGENYKELKFVMPSRITPEEKALVEKEKELYNQLDEIHEKINKFELEQGEEGIVGYRVSYLRDGRRTWSTQTHKTKAEAEQDIAEDTRTGVSDHQINEVRSRRKTPLKMKEAMEMEPLKLEKERLEREVEKIREAIPDKDFTGGHFEPNVLAHVRLNERTDAEGNKVLFLEEIQSDWIAALRKEKPGVPDAPFRKNWYEFLLKRMIRYAAENGFDKIAWTTGEMQAERYDLSKRIENILYAKLEDGSYELIVTDINGENVDFPKQSYQPNELDGVIGKDISKKIVEGEGKAEGDKWKKLEGLDLKVGGETHKHLYDKIIPSFLKKFGKKYGAKVGESEIKGPSEYDTPEPRYQVMQLDDNNWGILDSDEEIVMEGVRFDTEQEAEVWLRKKYYPSKPMQVPSLTITQSLKDAAIQEGFSLFQARYDEKKGAIQFGTQSINIKLLKEADTSTFLHETGHFFLEVLGDQSEAEVATQQIKDDYQTILNYLGVESRDQITREHHEKWARSFEAYLMEGKAPSEKLRASFQRFSAWLIRIYKRITALDVELTDEVRGVMDRLIATDEEIEAARLEQNQLPLFSEPASFMKPKEAESYLKAIDETRASQADAYRAELMEGVKKEHSKWYKAEEERLRYEVEAEVNVEPLYNALAILQTGKLPDGSELPPGQKPFKLNKQAIIDLYGKDKLARLPKPLVYSPQGMNPDQAAEILNFASGDELIQRIEMAEPKEARIKRLTSERMREIHGEGIHLPPQDLMQKAIDSVHTTKRSQLLHRELKHLVSNNFAQFKKLTKRISRPVPAVEEVKNQAKNIIRRKKVRDIQPFLYQRAEAKAAKEAMDLFLKGDFEGSFEAKSRELLNHELFRAATEAKKETEKIVNYVKRFDKNTTREKIGKAGSDYLEQIDDLSSRYDLRKSVSGVQIDKRKSLLKFVEDQKEAGHPIDVPEKLLAEAQRQHYKDTPFTELEQVRDTIKNIEHIAKLKNKLLTSKKQREFQVAKDEIIASIQAHHKMSREPKDLTPGFKEKYGDRVSGIFAEHTKAEFIFEYLDGWKKLGSAWNYMFRPIAEAEAMENEKLASSKKQLFEILDNYSRKEKGQLFTKKRFFPEARTDKFSGNLTKSQILSVALNWGNEYNRQSLMEGYGWNESQVKTILDSMEQRDWNVVQQIWDMVDSFWGEISQLEKEVNGIVPEKVEASEVETKYGKFKGGYYPLIFDSNLPFVQSIRQSQLETSQSVQEIMGGSFVKAHTRHGHTKERNDSGGKPVKLELTVLNQHLANVIHDLSFRRAIIDGHKLINDPEIRNSIIGSAGFNMYKQLNPWLMKVASDRRTDPSSKVEQLLASGRSGATVVNMGFKLTTAIVQWTGFAISTKEIGVPYMLKGMGSAFSNIGTLTKLYKELGEKSDVIKFRLANWDRDIRDATKKETIWNDYFRFIGIMDMVVSVPTWMGAYQKAMDGKVENIEKGNEKDAVAFADNIIRTTQGAGGAKDLASVQTGHEIFKMFSMFYSYFSVQFNQFWKTHSELKMTGNIPKYLSSIALIWFVPAILEDLMLGRGPEDEDEYKQWMAGKLVTYPGMGVILLRDILNGALHYGYEPSAGFDVFEQLGRNAKFGYNYFLGDKDEITRSDARSIALTIGYLKKLPARQMWITGEYLYDYMTGEVDPENPAQFFWQGLVTGKPKE